MAIGLEKAEPARQGSRFGWFDFLPALKGRESFFAKKI